MGRKREERTGQRKGGEKMGRIGERGIEERRGRARDKGKGRGEEADEGEDTFFKVTAPAIYLFKLSPLPISQEQAVNT